MNTNTSEGNRQKAWSRKAAGFAGVLIGALLLAGCNSAVRVGALQTESQSVELGEAESVRVKVDFGAGELDLTSGAEQLLEADFTYNVARLKPEVEYRDGTLMIEQPGARGLPILNGISDFRNEWDLRLYDEVPMDLSVKMGAGSSNLQVAGLSLTDLDVNVGAGDYTIDLSGDWTRDLEAVIEAGAANIRLLLPAEVGARVVVEDGPHTVEATGLTRAGEAYTNAAYGASEVTLRVDLEVGIGQIYLEEEAE